MSWWVYLKRDGETVTVPKFKEGGTYLYGGSTEAALNITYNYGKLYREHLPGGLAWLDGKTAGETIAVLGEAVAALGISRGEDYWKATPGKAGYALNILLMWAAENLDAVWEVH